MSVFNQYQFRCVREMWDGLFHIHFRQKGSDDRWAYVKRIEMFVPEEGVRVDDESINIDKTAAQQLMDELWICGLRPSEGSGSAGSLAATERHLADMKKIVFHALKINS
jgi:hypothetical protein